VTHNRSDYIGDILERRLSRRHALAGLAGGALVGIVGLSLTGRRALAAGASSLTFTELQNVYDQNDHVAPGYERQILIRWGDPLVKGAPDFDPAHQTAASQAMQFGYNNDFSAFLPLPYGSGSSDHGLLAVNHEYVNPQIMFPGLTEDDVPTKTTKDQIDIAMAAMGIAVVEIRKDGGKWQVVKDSPYNRRITMMTEIDISGPAAGHALLQTSADASGRKVLGTNDNCSGGTTPWGTMLSGEEGASTYHAGDPTKTANAALFERYGYEGEDELGWARFYDRFNLQKEPNEPNRFEWVVETDPYEPAQPPVKRTALGRFNHEAATTVLNKDGRVVVYMGDDDTFEHLYKFVSKGRFDPANRAANRNLLDEGTLYTAKLAEDGSLTWLPLIHGEGPLTPVNGFADQAEVLIKTRLAADALGATKMDRPEDFEADPVTGRLYVVLTKNAKRKADQLDGANSRAGNKWGQIIELLPLGEGKDADHAATEGRWDVFLLAGDPSKPEEGAKYGEGVSANGWFFNPDNIAFDPKGRMWIATDGSIDFGIADGLYGTDTQGPARAATRMFYACPKDAELCGPTFTPDGATLFLSVQHPGERSKSLAELSTRWPDFKDDMPPRPAIVVITNAQGSEIGV